VKQITYEQLDALIEKAQQSLKYALNQRKLVILDVDCTLPRLTIPENFTDPKCPAVVLDLGHFTLQSDTTVRENTCVFSDQN